MYQLKKNLNKPLKKGFQGNSVEKSEKSIYLPEDCWSFIDQLADETGISRNKVLQNLVRQANEVIETGDKE